MNLEKLFPIQKELDKRIKKEHGLKKQDLLDKKILALQVELGELANEWRGFKFWSVRQKPTENMSSTCKEEDANYFYCGTCHEDYSLIEGFLNDRDCSECGNGLMPMKHRNPLLEEYVDCLHFILSIGLDTNNTTPDIWMWKEEKVVNQFIETMGITNAVYLDWKLGKGIDSVKYEGLLSYFMGLGNLLGFTEQQIYDAYMDKNQTNHARQDTGY